VVSKSVVDKSLALGRADPVQRIITKNKTRDIGKKK
jgi:hypothetical protein